MAGVTTTGKGPCTPIEMGMHTEALPAAPSSASSHRRGSSSFGYPDAADVDFNKRAEIDCAALDTQRDQSQAARADAAQGYGTIVLNNPGAKHSLAVGILNRLNLYHRGQPAAISPAG